VFQKLLESGTARFKEDMKKIALDFMNVIRAKS